MSATGQSCVGSAVGASACASVPGDPKNRLFMRSRNDELLDCDGDESSGFDEQPVNATRTSPASAYLWCRNALPHIQSNPVPYSRPKVADPRPLLWRPPPAVVSQFQFRLSTEAGSCRWRNWLKALRW